MQNITNVTQGLAASGCQQHLQCPSPKHILLIHFLPKLWNWDLILPMVQLRYW